jgi:hypothetical protein
MISGTAFPMACSRINYCQLAGPDCRADNFTCRGPDDCCSGRCTAGRCGACSNEGEACTSARNCCLTDITSMICGDDNKCHSSAIGDGPDGGLCTSAAFCAKGYCDMPDASVPEGVCRDPAVAMCSGVESPQTASALGCCSGFGVTSGGNCCMPLGSWCEFSTDCCSDNCWGERCEAAQPVLGEHCDNTNNCQGLVNYCDPVARICTDRWCFGSVQTLYKGCCTVNGGETCNFLDGGGCVLGGFNAPAANVCCAGTYSSGMTCDFPTIYD